MEGTNEILELQVLGDWAFTRNRIDLTVTAPSGEQVRRSGYTLSLLRRGDDGHWRVARDANLLTVRS
jgi:ketosteroid isomerase-like protein